MTRKLIDCFSFYNELDLLKYRLEYLYDIVDNFVLVESTLTHSGDPKELYFDKNKNLFQKFNDKIIHVIVEDLPDKFVIDDPWVRELGQRKCIKRGLSQISLDDDDLIGISDLDEIPDRRTLKILKNAHIENHVYALEQDLYYYNLCCRCTDKWYQAKIVNFYTYKELYKMDANNVMRGTGQIETVKEGGWHFSCFGDVKFIQNKMKHYLHHKDWENSPILHETEILKQIQNSSDFLQRPNIKFEFCDIQNNSYLPENYADLLKFTEISKNSI